MGSATETKRSTRCWQSLPELTVGNGFKILRACSRGHTKYSNVLDLKSRHFLRSFRRERDKRSKTQPRGGTQKGGHYYDMSQLREQLAQAPRLLLANMERFLLAKYKPIPYKEP